MTMTLEDHIQKAEKTSLERLKHWKRVKGWKFDTIAVHGMYCIQEATKIQGGVFEPIVMSSSQSLGDSYEMEAGGTYQIPAWCYSRIHNPTIQYLEDTLALLETYGTDIDASCLVTSSGMAAIKQVIEPLLEKYDENPINFVSSAKIYGGTFQLFNVRMKERGVETRWIKNNTDVDEWEKQIDNNTRFLYAEMPSNPQQSCIDIAAIANLAHKYNIPLIVDATIATPALVRPIQHGADIVIHSLTKTIGSGGGVTGGAIIAKHNIESKFLAPEQKENYAIWTKGFPFRDAGCCMSPITAYLILSELKSLRVKMKHFSENTEKVTKFLSEHPRVEKVDYLGLEDHPLHDIAKKYMKLVDSDRNMYGHLFSFNIAGDLNDTRKFFDNLCLIARAFDLGKIKSVAVIPSISTHKHQGGEGQKIADIPPNMVRLCVGGENADDIINDLAQALDSIKAKDRRHLGISIEQLGVKV